MPRTRIKFCGVTSPTDAAAAAAAGADAVGVVFYPAAARRVFVPQAREIVAALPPFVTPVGLFVDATIDEVRRTASDLRLTTVQLHGDETPAAVAELGDVLQVIKAVRVTRESLSGVVAAWRSVPLAGLLLEPAGGPGPGGNGVANDWNGIEAAQRAGLLDGLPPLILAGGLTAESVGDVVRHLRPFAVDVSSGIEQTRGVKSVHRMAAFAAAVESADTSG